MDSWEINKILGALLAIFGFTVGLGILSEALFEPEKPEKPGFSVAVATAPAPDAAGATAAESDPPVEKLLVSADPARGQNVFRACAACHTAEKGGPNRVGPNLHGVVGGPKTHMQGFNYSAAMKVAAAKGPWDYAALYQFLKKPSDYVPGTAMGFAGLRKPQDRADVIAYLRTLSDNPPPLPK